MTDLKPCPVPWCLDTDAEIECSGHKAYYVTCSLCGAKTPFRQTPEAAAEVWNTRPTSVPINEIARRQFEWVERMGWHNKTVLEALALIASEVGEAVNECRGDTPSDQFGTELADIILRVADLAQVQGIDLGETIQRKMDLNEHRGTRGRRV